MPGVGWVLIPDEHGVLVARTDYPTESDIDLSPGALIAGALSGDETSGAWVDERRRKLFMAVAVPLRASPQAAPQGSLIAAYAIDDTLAHQIRQATTTDVVFFALDTLNRPYIVGSTLPREAVEPALVADTGAMAALTRDTAGTELAADVDGERLIGLASPIRSAGGDAFGGFVAFRSHERELGAFRVLQDTIGFSLAPGHAVRQPLRGEGGPRDGRDGCGVPGVRPRAAGGGGDQGAPSRSARGEWRRARALQAGDPASPQNHPSQRGAHVRSGRGERDVLPHDGIRGGDIPEAAHQHPRAAAGVRHPHDR